MSARMSDEAADEAHHAWCGQLYGPIRGIDHNVIEIFSVLHSSSSSAASSSRGSPRRPRYGPLGHFEELCSNIAELLA